MLDILKCEKIEIPQGSIHLGPSDENKSVGYLELDPHTSLVLHNRPAIENLIQVKNKCEMVVFWEERKIIVLKESDRLTIKPAGTYHIHTNPYDEVSLTYWEFDGDVRKVIEQIKIHK